MLEMIPNFQTRSYNRRVQLAEQFKEIEYEAGNVLEVEGTDPKYLYMMFNGEVNYFKRPESLYD